MQMRGRKAFDLLRSLRSESPGFSIDAIEGIFNHLSRNLFCDWLM